MADAHSMRHGQGKWRSLAQAGVFLALLSAWGAGAQTPDPSSKAAVESQPVVPSVRGGTLGLPPTTAAGVNTLLNNQIPVTGNGEFGTSFFAEVGRIRPTSWLSLDVLGEMFQGNVPTTIIPSTGVPLERPLPVIEQFGVTALGMRFNFGGKTRDDNQENAQVSECLTLRHNPGSADAQKKTVCAKLGVNMDAEATNENDIEAWTRVLQRRMAGLTLMTGFRFLYGTSNAGVALELSPQYLSERGGVFISGSYLRLGGSRDNREGSITQRQALSELRAAAGAHLQFRAQVRGSEVLPRLGIYTAYSRNFWDNPFFSPGTNRAISGYQLEGAIYASGHFTSGFHGLISFGVLKPYGPAQEDSLQYIISVAPAIGASLPE